MRLGVKVGDSTGSGEQGNIGEESRKMATRCGDKHVLISV